MWFGGTFPEDLERAFPDFWALYVKGVGCLSWLSDLAVSGLTAVRSLGLYSQSK